MRLLQSGRSISSKLLVAILVPALLAVAVGLTAVIVYDIASFRTDVLERTKLLARVVAEYSVTELVFDDPDRAAATLAQLATVSELDRAELFDVQGRLFAEYSRVDSDPYLRDEHTEIRDWSSEDSYIDWRHLHVLQPVELDGEQVGTLHLLASTRQLRTRIQGYLSVVLILAASLTLVSLVAALRLSRLIAEPVLMLAGAARAISDRGDYSTRVEVTGEDELGALCEAWNEMVAQIERRQKAQEASEAALRHSEERFRSLIERSIDAIYVINDDNRYLYVNPTFQKLLGVTADEACTQGFDNMAFLTPNSRSRVGAIRQSWARGHRETTTFELTLQNRQGEILSLEVSASPIEWDGQPVRMGVMRDITERVRAAERLADQQRQLEDHHRELERYANELERSNRELDQFAYIVSHDLKAPLRAISNLSAWIEEDLGSRLTGESADHMRLLRQRVVRMDQLIDGILEYSRIGRVGMAIGRVDVGELLDEIIENLGVPSGFTVTVPDDLPTLQTSRVRLAQVFGNLLGNAVHHHPRKDGRIDVRADDLGEWYRFEVRDDGDGIAPEFHDRIFTIFQTLKPRDVHESTGVGLAIVKKIVEEQGGMLELRSDDGEGASFSFTWPKNQSQGNERSRP